MKFITVVLIRLTPQRFGYTKRYNKKQKELKEELLLNFDVEKIDSTLDKWLT